MIGWSLGNRAEGYGILGRESLKAHVLELQDSFSVYKILRGALCDGGKFSLNGPISSLEVFSRPDDRLHLLRPGRMKPKT